MAYRSDGVYDFTADNHKRFPQKPRPWRLLCGVGFACVALGGAGALSVYLAARDGDVVVAVRRAAPRITALSTVPKNPAAAPARPVHLAARTRPTAPTEPSFLTAPTEPDLLTTPTRLTAPNVSVALLHTNHSLGAPPGAFVQSAPPVQTAAAAPPQVDVKVTQAVSPLRPQRPPSLRLPQAPSPVLQALARQNKALAATVTDKPSLFQKLFGKTQEPGTELAYAALDGGVLNNGASLTPPNDGLTAVYDISAHTVYMPDGTTLEAHSGLGTRLDNPRFVQERMRGATPPHIYDLELRAGLFHGVQALRLMPVGGESNIFGRTGILAHTFMLGPYGESNGCVSFRNYNAFLRAYMNHEVKRMVVVARLD